MAIFFGSGGSCDDDFSTTHTVSMDAFGTLVQNNVPSGSIGGSNRPFMNGERPGTRLCCKAVILNWRVTTAWALEPHIRSYTTVRSRGSRIKQAPIRGH